jgi:hypothetical protein
MADLECGRQNICEPCKGLDCGSRRDVCIAVGSVAISHNAPTLTAETIQDLTYDVMAGIVDDDDHVTLEMKEAAVESTNQLIFERYGLNYG